MIRRTYSNPSRSFSDSTGTMFDRIRTDKTRLSRPRETAQMSPDELGRKLIDDAIADGVVGGTAGVEQERVRAKQEGQDEHFEAALNQALPGLAAVGALKQQGLAGQLD